ASRQAPAPNPAPPQQPAGSSADSDGAPPPKVRRPTITLAASAVPGTAESLQLEAENVAGELLARYPDLPDALHVGALLRARLRQTEQAQQLWKRCVELAPQTDQYRVNLAAIAMDRGNNELAAEALEPAVAAGRYTPDVTHHLAVALSNLGRNEEAEQLVVKAAGRHPLSAAHWLVLGQARLKLGKLAEADNDLRKALELGSRSPDLYFALANVCARQGKNDEAAALRQKFAELKAKEPLSAQERYQVLSTAEARQTALAVMIEAATVHARQKDSQEAERLLLRAIALDPGHVPACKALADLYESEGLLPEQRVVYERLVQIEPLNVANYGTLADLAAQLGEPAAAEAALKQAISVEPDLAAAYTTLAQFYLQEGKPSKARWYAQEALRRSETAQGYVLLATTCRLLGDEATAAAALVKAKELEGKESTTQPP
ncbi:MAG: tetratricopeptide repeat protein, partial [Planctomycetaceae bacterium]|nr:tetratricopeptide repeat protein [Planctomycetaceae bacterium]